MSNFYEGGFNIKAFYDGFILEITTLNDSENSDIITTSTLSVAPENITSDAWGNGEDFFD